MNGIKWDIEIETKFESCYLFIQTARKIKSSAFIVRKNIFPVQLNTENLNKFLSKIHYD